MRAVDIQNQNGFIEQLKRATSIKENIYQLVYFHMPFDSRAVQLDYNQAIEFQRKPIFPAVSTFYTLLSVKKNILPPQKHITIMIENFNKYLIPNFKHFYILLFILTLKLGSILLYIYLKQGLKQLDKCLEIMIQGKRLQKLDITSPVNFETWEVARKFILSYKKEYLEVLEMSYFAFIFYYFFVIIICLSAYFDLYWLIPKESHLLKPASVIINTFNFIFLNVIFILRLNVGTDYNYQFEQLNSHISFLQVMMSNLNAMYPQFFLQDQMSKNKEDRYSAYSLIVKRIKQLSTNIIETKSFYYNKVYSTEEKHELRRQIIQNIKVTLKKTKESILLDQAKYSYKFANMMEINKNDFIFTLFIGIASALPKILPILILFYLK
ncbi:transmembrane protein, putative (macronuclear) [Tetrahymena thermophila SB210]|uniref:Transmembrane protein, putative n=1 Tax=Tetrahymena thermophila (strain SB210) TaxID=312017 RepID=Q246B1_TETTS|nr:transmembrane protein, putative [Tetrahymena thermophila SB210]EAS03472.2 transmembrane protein, putative [Tetrahymena thermophila SB210]|eukprot:XP_001023717.2 transmembrane protein, putative [Tetrahymena thermophila SB210]